MQLFRALRFSVACERLDIFFELKLPGNCQQLTI